MQKDVQTVTPDGISTERLIHGVTFRDVPTHVDDRGFVCEVCDSRWAWFRDPLVFSYVFTIRPGTVKGWGLHKKHQDRYCILFGDLEVVLYDPREDSPTKGLVSKFYLSESHRRLVNIPADVWHANRNVGHKDAVVINFPSSAYDHADPDKYRLPIDTDQIPYRFDHVNGW
jgi:dTDP-4-dehydrorhamnose 3,5-epimerase